MMLPNPPGHTETVHAERVTVLAPHPDDEVLGCGGLMVQLAASGAEVGVMLITDGAGGRGAEKADDPGAYAELRRSELGKALEILGASALDGPDLPDGELERHQEALVAHLRAHLLERQPDLLLVPSPLEVSRDHRATFEAVHRLLGGVRAGDPLEPIASRMRILLYEVNHALYPDLLVDVSEQVPAIEEAMACHASQQERHDYLAAGLGRRRFRTFSLAPGVDAVEAYRRARLEDFTTHGRHGLLAHFGAPATWAIRRAEPEPDGPLVSVIVRTKDRPELLKEALGSLAASTYRRLEVVLVNDGGAAPDIDADFPLPVERVSFESNRGRAEAANAGVAAANGDYIAFLDDDDLVEPDHYEILVGLVGAAGVRVAYTDAAVGVYRLESDAHPDSDSGWRLQERRLPYSRDFDPELLLVDNYIPFHTLLIERGLFEQAGPSENTGPFDPELPFFEDWDFLVRLAALTPFHHLARVSCEYRQFRGAGHHVLGDRPRERSDFLDMKVRVLERHRDRLAPEVVGRVVDGLRAESVALGEELKASREQLEAGEDRFHRLNGRLGALEEHELLLQDRNAHLDRELGEERQRREQSSKELAEVRAFADEQGEKLKAAYAEIGRLTALLEEMRGTRAWRLHESLRKWRPGS